MKKTLLSAILLFAFLVLPFFVSAQTPTETELFAVIKSMQAQIVSLVEKVDTLTKEVAALKANVHIVSPSPTSPQNKIDYSTLLAKSANAEINILSPNGGEITQASTTMAIKWIGKNIPEESVITAEVVDERGKSTEILKGAPNTGSVSVMLPELSPGFYRLHLSCGIKDTDLYCSSDGTLATNKNAEDTSDGTFIITSAGPIPSGGGGGGTGGDGSASSGGNGTGGGGAPVVTTIEMQPGNDYYFKGPATLKQLSDMGFGISTSVEQRSDEMFYFIYSPPDSTDSEFGTYYRVQNGDWYKFGDGDGMVIVNSSKITAVYFVIRKNSGSAGGTFTLPSSVTYLGSEPSDGKSFHWSRILYGEDTPSGSPDITITNIEFVPGKDVYDSSGFQMKITIKNIGTAVSGGYSLTYRDKTNNWGLGSGPGLPALRAGAEYVETLNESDLHWAVEGNNEIEVTIRPQRASADQNTSNNVSTDSFNFSMSGQQIPTGLSSDKISMTPGNDYYFKGPATLQQLTEAGFVESTHPIMQAMGLFTIPHNPPLPTDSADGTYFRWRNGWHRVGTGALEIEPSTQTSTYFIVRVPQNGVSNSFTIPSGVTYFGSTVMNGLTKPWY